MYFSNKISCRHQTRKNFPLTAQYEISLGSILLQSNLCSVASKEFFVVLYLSFLQVFVQAMNDQEKYLYMYDVILTVHHR